MMSSDAYWGVDLPGATESQARTVAEYARERFSLHAFVINPGHFLSVSMDAHTVRSVLASLETSDLGPDYKDQMSGMIDDFRDWLDHEDRVDGEQ